MTARQLALRGQYVPAGERVIPQRVTSALSRSTASRGGAIPGSSEPQDTRPVPAILQEVA